MNRASTISFLTSAGLGAVIWTLSPVITGMTEPWDAESPYYYVALLVAGVLVGTLFPKNIWPLLPGIVVGQLIYMLVVLPIGPLLMLGVLYLIGFGLLALLGAVAAARSRNYLRDNKSQSHFF